MAEDKANSMTERIGYPEYITNDTRLEGEYTNVSPHGMCTLHFGNGVHNGAIILCTVADLRILMAPYCKSMNKQTDYKLSEFISVEQSLCLFILSFAVGATSVLIRTPLLKWE